MSATCEDLCCILVEALDEKGALCSLTDNLICFDVEGLAKIKPVGNVNPFRSKYFRQAAGSCIESQRGTFELKRSFIWEMFDETYKPQKNTRNSWYLALSWRSLMFKFKRRSTKQSRCYNRPYFDYRV